MSTEREQARFEQLEVWAREHDVNIERLDEGQKWVLFFAIKILALIEGITPLRRLIGYLLVHSDMGLKSPLVGKLLGVSDRAVRYTQSCTAGELWESIRNPVHGHREPKLGPEQAGRMAKYLVAHPKARAPQILQFVAKEFGVFMDRRTLRHYIQRYGLGCLRGEEVTETPLF